MNRFIEECRTEWKRLGVPDPIGDEMAAELRADLAEAATEGGSVEDVLGTGALDPRSFARAWAEERGVMGPPAATGLSRTRRWPIAVATTAFALLAIAGGVLVVLESPDSPARVAIASVDPPPGGAVWIRAPAVSPDRRTIVVPAPSAAEAAMRAAAAAEASSAAARRAAGTVRIVVPSPALAGRLEVDVEDSGFDRRILGSVLLSVGLTGLVLSFLVWLGLGRRPAY